MWVVTIILNLRYNCTIDYLHSVTINWIPLIGEKRQNVETVDMIYWNIKSECLCKETRYCMVYDVKQ